VSSRSIAVSRTRGLMSTGTGFRSYAGERRHPSSNVFEAPLRDGNPRFGGEAEPKRLPSHGVDLAVPVRELGDGKPSVPVAHGRLRSCAAQRGAGSEQKPREIDDRRNGVAVLGRRKPPAFLRGEPKGALPGFIIDHEQVVDLGEGAGRLSCCLRPAAFGAAHENAAPAVGGRVADRADQRLVGRRMEGSGCESERGLE